MSESRGSSYGFVCFLKDKNLKSQFATSKEKGVENMDAKEKKEVTIRENEQIVDVEITENAIKSLIYVVRR